MTCIRLSIQQFIRYGFTGFALNVLGYLIYLAGTWFGMEPKLTVTVLYPLSVLCSYFAHKRFSFQHSDSSRSYSLVVRYYFVYLIGYMINLGLLGFFHDRLGYPHYWVQAAAIFTVGGFLFVALKLFVFRKTIDLKALTP